MVSYAFIESFAGNAEASKQVRAMYPGEQAVTMDILQSAALDVTKNGGFGMPSSIRWYLGACPVLLLFTGFLDTVKLDSQGFSDGHNAWGPERLSTLAGSALQLFYHNKPGQHGEIIGQSGGVLGYPCCCKLE